MKSWEKKPAAALALVLALGLVLPGCQKPEPGGDAQKLPEASASREEAAATDPTHIYGEVKEDFLIDAEVSGPPAGVVPKVYRGHYKTFSKEEIDTFLNLVEDGIAEVLVDGIERKDYYYSGTCTSGGKFAAQANADGTTTTANFSYIREENKFFEYPIYYGQEDYDSCKSDRLAHLFEEPTDLACGSAAEAEGAVREALAALGLPDVVLNRTLYISHDRMAEADELMQTEEWGGVVKGEEISQFQEGTWTEADDCYLFEFFSGVEGIPMTYQSWKRETTTYCGNEILVWYDAGGVLSLQVEYPWVADEVAEEPETAVSAEEALQVVQNKIGNVITGQNQELQSLSLRYLYRQDGDTWLLIPIWEAAIYQTPKDPDSWMLPSCTYVTIDAITGKEIVS